MKNLAQKFANMVVDSISIAYPYKTQQIVLHSLFSYIGVERLERLIAEAKKRDERYISLAEMYAIVLRENLAKENSDIIHNYYELLPKLDAYKKAFNEVIK